MAVTLSEGEVVEVFKAEPRLCGQTCTTPMRYIVEGRNHSCDKREIMEPQETRYQ